MKELSLTQLKQEFDRQVANLLKHDYHKICDLPKEEFLEYITPLKDQLDQLALPEVNLEKGHLPFVIVIRNELVSSEKAMSLTEQNGKQGVTILRPHISQDFKTIDEITVPESKAYLLLNIDRGKENINLPPSEAMKLIKKTKRSPLTINEGIAIITHFPEFLIKNNCFSLLASRTGKDQRVPAIWINSKKEPNLGWCWDGNPHTWLGSASASNRIGI
ncbi:hypothetical protein IT417_00530 [bacterium]|nr:hypothetical protein [bacterium]